MDPRDNPYAPGTGNQPPLIAGRDDEREAYSLMLDRLKRGNVAQGMLVTGLRGVGNLPLTPSLRTQA